LGLADPRIHRTVSALTRLALSGADRLGDAYVSREDIAVARTYFDAALRA
jgi:hypothetical protein